MLNNHVEGFIKYSAIYEGNKADCDTVEAMLDKLVTATAHIRRSEESKKPIVVMDAGIATKENLKMITDRKFDYVSVSRSSLKKYTVVADAATVTVYDRRKRPIELVEVRTPDATHSEYYLKVTSPTKTLKESSMYKLFCTRYEEGLKLIVKGITSKGGIKKYDKVNQRIGRLAQKYPSVHKLYDIHIEKNEDDVCTCMTYEKKAQAAFDRESAQGVYFLRTSLRDADEKLVWTVYNCIREIESTNRSLKSDLDLRPIFHKTDDASQAHLHLGLMAYWVVNTIRCQLKDNDIRSDWRELVRIMNTQKCVTTSMQNDKGQIVSSRCCSKPEPKADMIYKALKLEPAPFIRKKSVVLKIDPKKNGHFDLQIDTS